ncbi:hypothetical protein HYFRA_00003921 [Hymenoscyphus fraxineus]|uniref:Uncharacterized protein n=1 Tax=Hymenoscyphus fraxineus TaxID=746836 RepID=A0A9N9L1M6_9HELO|nr:hypothetical protein HYFRA_00003921 [Hymenoscyphus fraxineus]
MSTTDLDQLRQNIKFPTMSTKPPKQVPKQGKQRRVNKSDKVEANKVEKPAPKLLKKAPSGSDERRWPAFQGIQTMQINSDPLTQREHLISAQGQQRMRAQYTAPQLAKPRLAIQAPLAPKQEENTMPAICYQVQGDPRNGPVQMMWDAFEAKINALENEVLKLQREKAEVQKSNDELVDEFKKVAGLAHVALGGNVARGIGNH